jgi:limonene-1,2-epoxide hydrolase
MRSFTPRSVAEAYWRAEESQDVDRILSHFHPDATFHPPAGPLVGHDEIRTFYEGMGQNYPRLYVRIVREVSSDDQAALEWEAELVDLDGNLTQICGVNVVKVRDGKFTHVRAYFDPATFEQPEQPASDTLSANPIQFASSNNLG